MKKKYLIPAIALSMAGSLLCNSCIGSFGLTKKLMAWNNQVGDKFVNEVVFFALWFLPAYPVSILADLFVLNSIEFWSGNSPLASSERVIKTPEGRYLVKTDPDGYTIEAADGRTVRLDYCADDRTWSLSADGGDPMPIMTFVDDSHVMIPAASGWQTVELSRAGVAQLAAI